MPKDRKPISCKWVFKKKYSPSGQIVKYKARLVARGFTQQHKIDYNETFAPTLRFESLRILISLAIQYGLILWLLDVVIAYLNGKFDVDIFMALPEGLLKTNINKNKVLKILKSLYGLKQSGRIWNETFKKTVGKAGFYPITSDPCIFKKEIDDGDVCLIALYVDDIIVASAKKSTYRKVKEIITSSFEVTDSGELFGVLGIRINRDPKGRFITMDQTTYVEGMLEKHGITNCNPISTPFDGYNDIRPADDDEELIDERQYQQLVGELIFLNQATRPDLSFAISKLFQFCNKPIRRHYNTLTRVLKYLHKTKNLGLVYRTAGSRVRHYTDAAFADNKKDRRSTHGYVGVNVGAACVWYSRKQRSVVTSTVEAEYIALAEGCKTAIWVNQWINEAGYLTEPIILNGDNNGSLSLAKNPEQHARTKHIDIQYHFVREKVLENIVSVAHVSSKDQLADIITKPLTKPLFERMRLMLGLQLINN